jgi:hypothetical protein
MTQAQLECSVAARTGESLRTVHRLGFQPDRAGTLEPEDLRLVVDCPFCGRAVPYPGRVRDGSPALAECLSPSCDVFFDFAEADVYATEHAAA